MKNILKCEHRLRNNVLHLHCQTKKKAMENNEYIKNVNYGNVNVVENKKHQWAVIDNEGNVIVPFDKYGWIDGFDSGLARVRTHGDSGRVGNTVAILGVWDDIDGTAIVGKENIRRFYENDKAKHPEKYAKWGIINEKGEEVLPLIYNDIWKFLGMKRFSTRVEINGEHKEVYFHDLNSSLPVRGMREYHNNHKYGTHYGEFAGSYAQDVMGYSDDVINDAFEGDPDAYWNID